MGRGRRSGYLMLGKGKKEMGISPDEDSEEVVQLLAEALECNDESW